MTNSLNLAPSATIALSPYQNLSQHLKQLRLSHILTHWESIEHQTLQEQWSYSRFLLTLCELEAIQRHDLRLRRALTETQLPTAKSFSNFDFEARSL